jgi:hypothetical protein
MRFPPLPCASLLLGTLLPALVAATSLAGCGRTDLEESLLGPDASTQDAPRETGEPDTSFDTGFPDVIFPEDVEFDAPFDVEFDAPFDAPFDSPIDSPSDDSSTCGDGTCDDGETCTSCPIDCGFCSTCGNGTCDPGESCSSCPQDCGACPACGDGFCNGGEDCVTCPEDCGVCMTCGDGTCSGTENCTNCPTDCGECAGCGDGHCSADETCVSCPQDCGSCAVCGNGVCNDGETCTNCPQDCGMCALKDCQQALLCAFGCLSGGLQGISVSCLTNCDAETCPTSAQFVNDAVDCAVMSLFNGTCSIGGGMGGVLTCIESACSNQIETCFSEPPCPAPSGG